MKIMGNEIDFNQLADEVGVEGETLPILFDALKRECDQLFPLLTDAVALQDFAVMHEKAHALKGIIGNMRLDDLYVITMGFNDAAKAADETFMYEEILSILKDQLDTLFKSFYAQTS